MWPTGGGVRLSVYQFTELFWVFPERNKTNSTNPPPLPHMVFLFFIYNTITVFFNLTSWCRNCFGSISPRIIQTFPSSKSIICACGDVCSINNFSLKFGIENAGEIGLCLELQAINISLNTINRKKSQGRLELYYN